MNFILQFISCVVDIILIIFLLKFIMDAPIPVTRNIGILGGIFAAFGAAADVYFGGNAGTMPVALLFPLFLYISVRGGRALSKLGLYSLAALLYISFSIISIFIEMLMFQVAFGAADTNTRFTIITICLNTLIIWGLWRHFGKRNFRIQFTAREWLMLLAVNTVTFLILTAVNYFNGQILVRNTSEQILVIVLNYSVLFFYVFFVLFLASGKVAMHFRELNRVSQNHMADQLKYFTSYKEMQEETRRFRHDIKNHLLYLQALSKADKTGEMRSYIQSLTEKWEESPRLFITGNDVIDTIINAKQFLLEEYKIGFTVSGSFTTELKMEPIDVCTVFSNAMDNAIEAVSRLPSHMDRYINFGIKSNRNFYLITMKNSIVTSVPIKNNHVLSDKKGDVKEHGYGLKNIVQALRPYNGYIKLKSTNEFFCIEIVFPK